MTKRLTRTKVFIATLVLAVLIPTTALATHVFDDVDDSRFYAGPVEWARDNKITTGTSPTTFEPNRAVTRGESVTFLERYDDNIVQPALSGLGTAIDDTYTKAEADAALVAGVETAIAAATAPLGAMNFSAIDVGLDLGESVDILTLDGVTITAECNDLAPNTGLRVAVTSASDGWYAPGFAPGTSTTVLTSADEVVWTTPNSPPATELAAWQIDGFSVMTPNGGYLGIDGETAMWVLNSTVHDSDCIYRGMLQWAEPAKA